MTTDKTKQIKKLTEEMLEHLSLKGKVAVEEDEVPSGLRPGYLLPTLLRERNPSEAENSSRPSTSFRSRFSAKGDKESAVFNIQIETEESGFLIGYHGETLEAFQMILSLIAYKKSGEWSRLVVNVGEYRQKREEQLKKLAMNVAQKVKFSKQAQAITNLSAGERRIIHLVLADDEQVMTESEGEGRDRKLVIKLKSVVQ